MALERTFSIIKPDATRRNLTGAINKHIEAAGLRIIGQKRIRMSQAQAEGFYGVHKERPVLQEPGRFHDLRTGGGAGAARARTRSPNIAK